MILSAVMNNKTNKIYISTLNQEENQELCDSYGNDEKLKFIKKISKGRISSNKAFTVETLLNFFNEDSAYTELYLFIDNKEPLNFVKF